MVSWKLVHIRHLIYSRFARFTGATHFLNIYPEVVNPIWIFKFWLCLAKYYYYSTIVQVHRVHSEKGGQTGLWNSCHVFLSLEACLVGGFNIKYLEMRRDFPINFRQKVRVTWPPSTQTSSQLNKQKRLTPVQKAPQINLICLLHNSKWTKFIYSLKQLKGFQYNCIYHTLVYLLLPSSAQGPAQEGVLNFTPHSTHPSRLELGLELVSAQESIPKKNETLKFNSISRSN